ncbi:MAG: UDP-N-acetylglucosamine 2-epimerase (non-hydrolyzing), partial [Saprospiraceae bacterium]
MQKKIFFIIGTRPEIIKFAPLIKQLEQQKYFKLFICFTGQHKELLDQTADFFSITANVNLQLMQPNQTLSGFFSRSLVAIEEQLIKEKPDLVFVQGDTTSVLSGAMAAYYQKIPIAHLEAGLRSNDQYNPFPEEMNRVLCSRLTHIHFAPTDNAVSNLHKEGISDNIYMHGNTVVDSLHLCLKLIKERKEDQFYKFFNNIDFNKKVVLVTTHRRENFGQPLRNILGAIKDFAVKYKDYQIIIPIHPNPQVKLQVNEELGALSNILLYGPFSYPQLVWLMSKVYFIVTDSGGIQEEAPSFKKPILV